MAPMTQPKSAPIAEGRSPARRSAGAVEPLFTRFVERLSELGYAIRSLQSYPSFRERHAYLRYDILPTEIDIDVGLQLAALHERFRLPGAFHIAWDAIAGHRQLKRRALRLRDYDPAYVHLGLHCDPLSFWLADDRFGGDQAAVARFAGSPAFRPHLDEMLSAWRTSGNEAPALRAWHDGAWAALGALNRSFRRAAGRCSSLSGRGSPLAAAFSMARRARPELEALTAWFQPIDFMAEVELQQLGYTFEATRFASDLRPGPTVLYGGAPASELRHALDARVAGGGGFLAIFPARYWGGDDYAGLLSKHSEPADTADDPAGSRAAAPESAPLPDQPVLTSFTDLVPFGPRCERVDTRRLALAARRKIGGGIDRSFPRFIDWLRAEGYSFGGFEDGVPRFGERWAYLRYDVHVQDLLAAYVLADLHQRLAIVGSFQIMWKFSLCEEVAEPYFVKLLEFDRRFVQFGLHAAPTATWYLNEKLGGDYTRQRAAVESQEFIDWLLELHAAFRRDGDAAPALRELRTGSDDTLSTIAASFRDAFGDWKSISGHGNFLTNGFIRAVKLRPQLKVLRPYFAPVHYFAKFGIAQFGFGIEITACGSDRVPFPRVMSESTAAATRRRWYRGRVAHGAGFVALLHPATWTCKHNATFFLAAEDAAEDANEARPEAPEPGR